MITIKGFKGINIEKPLSAGDDAQRLRINADTSTLNRVSSALTNTVSQEADAVRVAQSLAVRDKTTRLSDSDRTQISTLNAAQSATTALTDIIEKIQSLTAEFQIRPTGSAAQNAIQAEIESLSEQYSSIVKSSARYTGADLEAFARQSETLSSASVTTTADIAQVSSAIAVVESTIDSIAAAMAPTVASLSSISSSQIANNASISSLNNAFNAAGALSSAVVSSAGTLATSAASISASIDGLTATQDGILANLAVVNSSLSANAAALDLLNQSSSDLVSSQTATVAALNAASSSIVGLTNSSNTNQNLIASASSSIEVLAPQLYIEGGLSSLWQEVSSYSQIMDENVAAFLSSGDANAQVSSLSSTLSELSAFSSALDSSSGYLTFFLGLDPEDPQVVSVSEEMALRANQINEASLSITSLNSVQAELEGGAITYTAASEQFGVYSSSLSEIDSRVASLSSAISTNSNLLTTYSSEIAAFGLALDNESTTSANLALSSLDVESQISSLAGEIAASATPDPALTSQSVSLEAAAASLFTVISSAAGNLATVQSSSLLLESSRSSLSASRAALTSSITAAFATGDLLIESSNSLSSAIAPSLSATSSLSSNSASLTERATRLANGLSSLSNESSALVAAAATAAAQAETSSGSETIDSVASTLREVAVSAGLPINLSTRALRAVTSEILNNRLTELGRAKERLATGQQTVVEEAADQSEQPSLAPAPATRAQPPKLTTERAEVVAQIVAKSILADPSTAMGAVGDLNAATVLSLIDATTLMSRKA